MNTEEYETILQKQKYQICSICGEMALDTETDSCLGCDSDVWGRDYA